MQRDLPPELKETADMSTKLDFNLAEQERSKNLFQKIKTNTKINLKDLDDDMKARLVDGAPSPLLEVLKDKFTELDTGNIEITKLEDKPVAKKIKKKIEDSEIKLNRIAEGYKEYYESRIKGEGLFYNKDFLKKQTDKDTKTLDDTLKDAALALDRAKALESNANETQRQLDILDKLMDKLDRLLGFNKIDTQDAYNKFWTNRPDLRFSIPNQSIETDNSKTKVQESKKGIMSRPSTFMQRDLPPELKETADMSTRLDFNLAEQERSR